MGARRQKAKGKKRPRAWHHGPDRDRHLEIAEKALDRATVRGERVDAEVAVYRAGLRDDRALYATLGRVNPPAGLAPWPWPC